MSDSASQLYLRVKRRNQTFCLLCNRTDKVIDLKKRLEIASREHSGDEAVTSDKMRLLLDATVLNDDSSLEGLDMKDDAALNLVFAVADDEFETVDVVSTAMEDA